MSTGAAVADQVIALRKAGETYEKIAATVGVAYNTVRAILKRAGTSGCLGTEPVVDGFEIKSIASKKDGAWIKQAREHGEAFTPREGQIVKGESALVDEDGRVIQKWVKTGEGERAAVTREDLLDVFGPIRGKSVPMLRPKDVDHSLLTVYPTSDLHLGMLSWGRETGTSWDLNIAREVVAKSIGDLMGCTPASQTAVLLDLGDQTHNNSQANTTPAGGNQLDVDGRFPKIGREALRLRKLMIEMALERHEHVIYRGLPGNHDPEVAQMLSIALELFFENNPRVRVDADPSDFWFYEHGTVMLCGNHGHRTKPDQLPGVMASYRPEMWGRTKVRQAFSGHIHPPTSGEANGARWETLRTLSPRDAYSHQHGYSAGRELLAVTYHKERGLRSRQVVEIV